jgi:release factor glutamine methyltransferase
MRIFTLPGVFQPRSDTWMLVDAVRATTLPSRARVLDVCTGSGAVAVAAALRGARSVTAVDLHRRSVWTARMNARVNGVRVRGLHGDLFAPVADERFDLITANPPYVPAPPGIAPQRGDRAWNAGHDGRAVIDKLIDGLPAHLRPGGVALIVQSSVTGTEQTLQRLHEAGLEPRVGASRRGPLGPILAARVDYLAEAGLLRGPHLEEQVLVIRGTRRTRARSSARDGRTRPSASGAAAARTPAA